MTIQFCLKNSNSSPFKNWISVGKYLEIRRKNILYYGDLYHYAGNNPMRYIDPDGAIQHDALEIRFVREVLGEKGLDIYNKISFAWVPNIFGLRPASWDISDGIVFLTSDIYSRPMASDYGRETLIHELYHQIQYSDAPYLESQAELVGNFASYYYNERYSIGIYFFQQTDMKRMAEILNNSGFNTEALKWVVENY